MVQDGWHPALVHIRRQATALGAGGGDADAAKQEIGALVKRLLLEKYPSSKQLGSVKVDPKRWPELLNWVANYTTYDIS